MRIRGRYAPHNSCRKLSLYVFPHRRDDNIDVWCPPGWKTCSTKRCCRGNTIFFFFSDVVVVVERASDEAIWVLCMTRFAASSLFLLFFKTLWTRTYTAARCCGAASRGPGCSAPCPHPLDQAAAQRCSSRASGSAAGRSAHAICHPVVLLFCCVEWINELLVYDVCTTNREIFITRVYDVTPFLNFVLIKKTYCFMNHSFFLSTCDDSSYLFFLFFKQSLKNKILNKIGN